MEMKPNTSGAIMDRQSSATIRVAIALMVALFFIFGIITVFNDVLIPHLKSVFSLTYIPAMLIQSAFFGAYFLMALPAARAIRTWGYKSTMVLGLLVVVGGCLLFYPASELVFYPLFLLALFIMASGITLLQVSANPYLAALGTPETATSRLNLAGGFNSFATVIGPLIGAQWILSDGVQQRGADAVQAPYLVLAVFIALVAMFIYFTPLPRLSIEEARTSGRGAWKHRNLRLGVLAIFLYVGAEVTVGSFLINYLALDSIAGLSESHAARYVALYWGGAMVGRFLGVAFLGRVQQTRALVAVAMAAFALVAISILSTGASSVWAIVAVGLCNSIMWPCIFPLGIKGLGEHTGEGSGLMIMAVVGGAIVPLAQGVLADYWSLQGSFVVALVCYGYLIFYGINGHKTA